MSWITSDRRSRLPKNWESEIVPAIMKRDEGKCKIKFGPGCEGEATDVDHINRGDDHRLENLQAGCGWCHSRKSAKEGNEAKARLRQLRKRPPARHPGSRT